MEIEAFLIALDDCTDYQVAQATRLAVKVRREFVPPAGELREVARMQDVSPEAKELRLMRERQASLPRPKPRPGDVRDAMKDTCREIIDQQDGAPAEFAASLLKRLERDTSDNPAALVAREAFQ